MNAAGDPAGAAAALRAALARAPAVHELANNLGSAELQLGRPAAGRVAFEHALRLEPGNALYRFNRGLALDRLGLVKAAAAAFADATAADPAPFPEAHYRFGLALDALQQYEPAAEAFRTALAQAPAVLATRQLQISGGLAVVRWDYHNALLSTSPPQHDAALEVLEVGLAEAENEPAATPNASHPLQPSAYSPQHAQLLYGVVHLKHYLARHNGLEQRRAEALRLLRHDLRGCAARPLPPLPPKVKPKPTGAADTAGVPTADKQAMRRAKLLRALDVEMATCGTSLTPMRALVWVPARDLAQLMYSWQLLELRRAVKEGGNSTAARRARLAARRAPRSLVVGLVSADFSTSSVERSHPMAPILSAAVRAHTRAGRVQVRCYDLNRPQAGLSPYEGPCAGVDTASLFGLDDDDAAALVRKHRVDVLLDLNGFTQGGRPGLFLRKPAPVVATWLGWPATMADPTTYDFGVTDAVVQPVESGGAPWSERLALLPPSLFPPADAAAFGREVAPRSERGGGAAWPSDERRAAARRAAGLPADDPETFVFAAHNQIFKVRPALLDALANLLRGSDGGSVLWIIDHPRDAVTAVRAELLARGVTHDAIVASPFVRNRTAHVERLAAAADLFLETDGYSGGATTCDALAAGIPVLAFGAGERTVARLAASLVLAASAEQWPMTLVYSLKEYEDVARKLVELGLARRRRLLRWREQQAPPAVSDALSSQLVAAWSHKYTSLLLAAVESRAAGEAEEGKRRHVFVA